jgi:resuscitation-promoting factor RpfB
MKLLLQKYQKWLFPGALLMILAGVSLIWFGLMQTNMVIIAGEPVSVRTNALRASGVLRAADISVGEDDRLVPAGDPWIWEPAVINIEPARDVMIKTPENQVTLHTAERIPANLVSQVEVALFPNDRVMLNGQAIDPNAVLEDQDDFALLQVQPAVPVNLVMDGRQMTVYSDQPTLGAALEAAAIRVAPQDWVSEDLMTPLDDDLAVTIRRARPVRVIVGETEVTGLTAAVTVGDALVDIGVTLQNLDHTEPPEDEPIPADGEIELFQVSEQVLILTDEVPYANEYVEDPNTELDQVSVVQFGQVGIFATRERVQYANGEELWRDTPESWQASQAADGLLGYGSRVEVRTAVVDGQEIEYWRKISVYATSYSPCRLGVPGLCNNTTASGLPVGHGTIAVTRSWFNMMKLQQVFVQGYGYGTIADIGGGSLYFNHYWIDLGYPDDSYRSWHHWTTMYFLTPVPAWFPAVLPWP